MTCSSFFCYVTLWVFWPCMTMKVQSNKVIHILLFRYEFWIGNTGKDAVCMDSWRLFMQLWAINDFLWVSNISNSSMIVMNTDSMIIPRLFSIVPQILITTLVVCSFFIATEGIGDTAQPNKSILSFHNHLPCTLQCCAQQRKEYRGTTWVKYCTRLTIQAVITMASLSSEDRGCHGNMIMSC